VQILNTLVIKVKHVANLSMVNLDVVPMMVPLVVLMASIAVHTDLNVTAKVVVASRASIWYYNLIPRSLGLPVSHFLSFLSIFFRILAMNLSKWGLQ
jgi:hypothetical protein